MKIKMKIDKTLYVIEKLPEKQAIKKYKDFIKKQDKKSIYVSKKYLHKGTIFYKYKKNNNKFLGEVVLCEKCSEESDNKKFYFIPFGSILFKPFDNCAICNHLVY